jgi:DnaA-homolog protein
VNDFAPQIPFELFDAEPPSFDNFLVGDNEEAVTQLYACSTKQQPVSISFWGGHSVGKTHLLRSTIKTLNAQSNRAILISADSSPPDSPFGDFSAVCADDVHRYDDEHQTWLFNAFNHVASQAGVFVVTGGAAAPALWPIREDLRTRLASGLVFELRPVPQNALSPLLVDYARKRGFEMSKEVLTYLLTYTKRDVGALCQTISGLDRLSLSLKRPITVPLVRAYLTQQLSAT